MQAVDMLLSAQDSLALKNLHGAALEGMASVLARKVEEFLRANPEMKPGPAEMLEMLAVALDDAVLVGTGEFAETSKDARAALLLLLSASNVTTRIFEAARPSAPDNRMLSTEEAAKALNVSRPYVIKLADSGKLGVVERTEGSHRRIPAAAVHAYREQRQTESREAMQELVAVSQEARLYDADHKNGSKKN